MVAPTHSVAHTGTSYQNTNVYIHTPPRKAREHAFVGCGEARQAATRRLGCAIQASVGMASIFTLLYFTSSERRQITRRRRSGLTGARLGAVRAREGAMGNEVAKKGYDVEDAACGFLGPKQLWHVHRATHKRSGRRVSVLLFDKTRLARAKLPKAMRESVIDVARKAIKKLVTYGAGVSKSLVTTAWLTVLPCRLRHPHVLQVVEQVDETSKLLAVIVEPIKGCLNDQYTHTPPTGASIDGAAGAGAGGIVTQPTSKELPSAFEVAVGTTRVAEALAFLHDHAHTLHMDVSPHVRCVP